MQFSSNLFRLNMIETKIFQLKLKNNKIKLKFMIKRITHQRSPSGLF
jgi:hypothetical protein